MSKTNKRILDLLIMVILSAAVVFGSETLYNVLKSFTQPAVSGTLSGAITPGTYSSTAKGFGGDVTVDITVSDSAITDVSITGASETPTLGGIAVEELGGKILEAQTPYVDGVSGATVTSTAIISAAEDALTQAGVAVDQLGTADAQTADVEKTEETLSADIVIVGAGGAGMTAAINATQEGKKVIILEKMPYAGGNTNKATGGMNAAETKYQKEAGIEDSVEQFVEDTMEGGHQLNDIDLVTTMAEKSASCIDWLDSIGAPLPKVSFSGGATNARIHSPEDGSGVGEYLVAAFLKKLDELGVEIMYNTKATELIEKDGSVIGVLAESDTANYTIEADAVILATGGFGANEEMYTKYRPDLKGTVTTNAPGATGDGIVMAEAVGAATVDIDQIQLHPTVEQSTSMLITEGVRGDGAILVNQSGKRFTNELLTRDAVSAAELEQEGSYAYLIFDQNLRDGLKAIEKYADNGLTVQADTVEELAKLIDMDPETLKTTVDTWNKAVADQDDKEFGRNTGMEADLSKAPYYAIKIAPGIHHTMGGLKINTSAEVLNTEGSAIPGLFAAGEVTGGVHGGNRIGGNAVTDIVVFGTIAAESAVEYCNTTGSDPKPASQPAASGTLSGTITPGTYSSTAKGFGGDVTVDITVSDSAITDVSITGASETPTLGGIAVEELGGKILEAQTPYVDGVSGATVTSTAIISAAEDALTQAGVAVDQLGTADAQTADVEKTEETLSADIVIVGAGGAGMTAAINATQEGKKVIILEKMPYAGGNTNKATGGMNAAETKYQKEAGIEDSVEQFVEDTMEGGHQLNDIDLVTTMAEKSASCIDWLDSIGAPLPKVSFSGGATNARIHSPEDGSGVGEYLVAAFLKKLDELGVEIMYNTKATELIEKDGSVIGVLAESDTANYTIEADAVILATGGFGANEEMYTKYRPDLKGTVTTNAPGATGDGIVMAEAVGAATVDIDQIQLHPTVEQSTSMLITEGVRGDGAILVNQSGKRFTNELLTRDAVSAAELEQEGSYAYLIFDQNLRDGLKAIEKYADNGLTVQADTVEELAKLIDMDPETLKNTVDTWNKAVADQDDKEFGRNTGMEADLSKAPYYAIKIAPGIHHTMGGLKINTSAEVLNTEGSAISGLFAAGEVTGGVHGGNRIGGNAVTDIVVFGTIAAESAVEYCNTTGSDPKPASQPAASGTLSGTITPGTYSSTAKGFGGDVTVDITVSDSAITDVSITGASETPTLGGIAVEELGGKILEAQTPYVDGVSGATVTSTAIISAAEDALTQAGVAVDQLGTADAQTADVEKTEETLSADIVIVGAGGAGMTAAINATQEGKKVIILEKMPYAGGNTNKATGGMNAAETKYQKEAGIEDSVEQFVEDTMEGGHQLNDIDLVTTMAEKSASCIDWLASIGAPLPKVSFSGGATNARIHSPEDGSGVGEYLVAAFLKKLDELGVEIMYNTKATELIQKDGSVTGVLAESDTANYTIEADAVILATGGFGANEEMYTKYRPDLKGTVTTNAPGATGDGIVMAEAVGAATVDLDQIQLHPTVEQSTSMLITEGVRGDGAILVNQSGKRFTNELLTRDAVSAAELEQEGSYAYLIFDQNLRDGLKAIEKYADNDLTVQADTVEELAELIDMDPETLKTTVDTWNKAVADQDDKEFGRNTGMEADLSKAPYYAIKIAPGIHHTMGGLKINTSAEVLNTEGSAIPGLFAAGEVTGGVHGGNRIGGNAVTDIVVFGTIAAESAVAYCGQ